jgi:hypothetical protein
LKYCCLRSWSLWLSCGISIPFYRNCTTSTERIFAACNS